MIKETIQKKIDDFVLAKNLIKTYVTDVLQGTCKQSLLDYVVEKYEQDIFYLLYDELVGYGFNMEKTIVGGMFVKKLTYDMSILDDVVENDIERHIIFQDFLYRYGDIKFLNTNKALSSFRVESKNLVFKQSLFLRSWYANAIDLFFEDLIRIFQIKNVMDELYDKFVNMARYDIRSVFPSGDTIYRAIKILNIDSTIYEKAFVDYLKKHKDELLSNHYLPYEYEQVNDRVVEYVLTLQVREPIVNFLKRMVVLPVKSSCYQLTYDMIGDQIEVTLILDTKCSEAGELESLFSGLSILASLYEIEKT